MNKERLKQYLSLKKEAKENRQRANNMRKKIQEVADVVQTSSAEYPYQPFTLTIRGKMRNLLYEQQIEKYIESEMKCMENAREIESWIETIEDSIIRRIFHMRYIDGRNWSYISMQCGSAHESYARNAHDKYLREHGTQ